MKSTLVRALGRRFVHLSDEASPDLLADAAVHELIERCTRELATYGLTLDNIVRTRLWARSAVDRDVASRERRDALSGKARSASSSYIAPGHFQTWGKAALDVIAVEPARRSSKKAIVEYEPAIVPVRYIVYDGLVFLSGVTVVVPTLEEAVRQTTALIEDSLRKAGIGWRDVVKTACYLRRDHDFTRMEKLLLRNAPIDHVSIDFEHVDGYSSAGKHVEIEVTAALR
jgi:enamine deaminase RidA (YjgF/YER057c/UK114 family)